VKNGKKEKRQEEKEKIILYLLFNEKSFLLE